MYRKFHQKRISVISLALLLAITICALLYFFSPIRHDINRDKATELGKQYAIQECNEMVKAGSEYDCSDILYGSIGHEPGSLYSNWIMKYSVKARASEKRYEYNVCLTRSGKHILANGDVVE